ncbi:hypothetical protein DFH06DRAFT_1244319 [Mycena polygramma]|nr:hypothetical protein DFH06DRAFT_1244319 [Mycena polygramma]
MGCWIYCTFSVVLHISQYSATFQWPRTKDRLLRHPAAMSTTEFTICEYSVPKINSSGRPCVHSGPILLITALNILFILRLHALYHRSLKMLACLAVLFLRSAGLVLTVVVTADTIRNASEAPRGVHWPGGVTTVSSFSELVAWSVLTVTNLWTTAMFFILTMIKFVVVFRTGHSEWSLKKLREYKSYSPILAAFVRDGTDTAVLVNTIATLLFKGPFMGLVLPWLTATYSFSASRLVLNIRSAAVLANPIMSPESFSLDFRRPVMQDSLDTDEGEAYA